MKIRGIGCGLLAWLALGCAGGPSGSRPTAPLPIPSPQPSQLPVPVTAGAGAWSFKYSPGVLSYRISRTAAIESNGLDSARHREVSTNLTHESLTLEPTDQATNFTAVIDTFATTTQGLIGAVQPVDLPVQFSGSFTDSALVISNEARGERCNALGSMLVTDLHNLLIVFPAQMSAGMSWKDSLDVRGCQAGVPTSIHITRSYVVSGEAPYEGRTILLIQRADTTRAVGEGGLQQHRIAIDGSGTGTALYYLDTAAGRIVHLTVNQLLNLGVTASGRRFQFAQDSKQDFSIVP